MLRLLPILLLLTVACAAPTQAARPPSAAPSTVPSAAAAAHCIVRYKASNPLPDPACTPGVTDPRVTQDNIQDTICKPGYSASVRPAESITNRLKVQQMAAYGFTDALSAHEEDHLISLELGGAPSDPLNLWPEPGSSPNPKDKIENELHRLVCSGPLHLDEAQRRIATDWTTALTGP